MQKLNKENFNMTIKKRVWILIPLLIIIGVGIYFVVGGLILYFSGGGETEYEAAKTAADCEKISFDLTRDACYQKIAQETKDVSICEKISYDSDKKECYAVVTMNVSICEEITVENRKKWCYLWVAGETGNVNICEKISDNSTKRLCIAKAEGLL